MTKNFLAFTWLSLYLLTGNVCYGQYSISGYLDTPEKGKRVYLSLLRYDEQQAMSKDQNLFSTLTDSKGYFRFTGKLLSNQNKLYRIHANLEEVEEDDRGFDFADTDEFKNFHNFIFSNTDTIVFEKSKDLWFQISENTNPVDKQWQEIKHYKKKLLTEFSEIKNKEARMQSLAQLLADLKTHVREMQSHPLVKLILLDEMNKRVLQRDFEKDHAYYFELQRELNDPYANTSYALQFEELLSDLSQSETQQQLIFYKRLVYLLSLGLLVSFVCMFFLGRQVVKRKKDAEMDPIHLTKQEEKIAMLILQEKSNKEIASALFISLSTVKTHIRNLYAKYEVSNRQQFAAKMKNHPRD